MVSANEIPAGGEGKITVTVQVGSRRRQIRQIVNVQTNAPEHPTTKLIVTGNVLVDLEVIPSLLRLEVNQSSRIVLKNYLKVPVQLRNITSSNKYVKVSVSSMTIPANGEVILTGELLSDVPAGVVDSWIKIETNLKSIPIIQIRAWGHIQK